MDSRKRSGPSEINETSSSGAKCKTNEQTKKTKQNKITYMLCKRNSIRDNTTILLSRTLMHPFLGYLMQI